MSTVEPAPWERIRVLDPDPVHVWQDWWRNRCAEPHGDGLMRRAAERGFVLTTRDLAEAGISRSTARHAIRSGRWTSAGRGAVAPFSCQASGRSDPGVAARRVHALAAVAASHARPDAVLSDRSAAIVHGLPTMRVPDRAKVTARHPTGNGRRVRAHVYAAALSDAEITSWHGVPVTTVARTLVDLARHDRRDGIMAADAALRAGLVLRRDIDEALRRAAGWPGVCQARALLPLADPRAESPLESITRLALIDDDFPPMNLQLPIGHYFVDIAVAAWRLVIEADGQVKYDGVDDERDALWREKQREHAVRGERWWVERVTWFDVTVGWRAARGRLRAGARIVSPAPRVVWR